MTMVRMSLCGIFATTHGDYLKRTLQQNNIILASDVTMKNIQGQCIDMIYLSRVSINHNTTFTDNLRQWFNIDVCAQHMVTFIRANSPSPPQPPAMNNSPKPQEMDDFLVNYDAVEIRIAAEFLSNWLPFLSRGLCESCIQKLADGIRSLPTEAKIEVSTPPRVGSDHCQNGLGNCSYHSMRSTKDSVENNSGTDTHSLVSWKDEADYLSEYAAEGSSKNSLSEVSASSIGKNSWADMAMEDELLAEDEVESGFTSANDSSVVQASEVEDVKPKVQLSVAQREYIRFNNVQRKNDFECLERVNGKLVNILEGLELHKGVFSAAEQKKIVNFVEELQEKGQKGQLRARTYTAPQKWMRGKGRVTLQFGCCYNYATDKHGNPPGILKSEMVDPLPDLFKIMIRRLVRWHVLPTFCVPDSCIVNIYDEGDCIPPHIDNHDFFRPFCTVSFLSECKIVFGSNLKIVGPGEFAGLAPISLPVGSVLVLNGNGADVAKHCVPAVPFKRISITFRRMDVLKRPLGHVPEPDLQGIQPLPNVVGRPKKLDEMDKSKKLDEVGAGKAYNPSRHRRNFRKPVVERAGRIDMIDLQQGAVVESAGRIDMRQGLLGESPNARYSGQGRQGPFNRRRG